MDTMQELKEATRDYVNDPETLEVFNHPLVSGHRYYDVPGPGSQEPLVTPQVALSTSTPDYELETLVQQLKPYASTLITYMLKTGHSLYEHEVRVYLDTNFIVPGESYYVAYENGGTWSIVRDLGEVRYDLVHDPLTLMQVFQAARAQQLAYDASKVQ